MATFPATLPKPMQSSYQEERQDGVLRSQMDMGPPKVRLRFTATMTTYSVSWQLSGSQVSTFESFFITDTLYGAIPFTWTQPRTGSTVTARFSGATYQVSSIGHDLYQVSAKLEVLP